MGMTGKYACVIYTFLLYCQNSQSCHPCWVKNQIHESIFQVVPIKSCNGTQIFHRESDACYDFHPFYLKRGPCGENMVLMESANPKLGECKCEKNSHPLVYIPKVNQCYKIFTQGPCSTGKWLNFENGSVKCSTNPCKKDMVGEKPPVLFKGKCVSLDSRCSIGKLSGRVELNESFMPECTLPKMAMLAIGGIGPSHCPSNFFRTPDGARCQEPIYFDFD